MTSPYEELYGVGLLDDLHNHFPALLYEPQHFQNVQQVLRYIQDQTRNRFDLFSLGQREYRGRNSPPAPPPPPPPTTNSVRLNMTSDVSGGAGAANSNLLNRAPRFYTTLPPNPLQNTINYMFTLNPEDEEEDVALTTQLMRTLLTLPLAGRGLGVPPQGGAGGLDAFLQPIVVRPTAEQIAANTTVGNLVSDTEHACAICQDTLQSDQEGRKLNACGHWFHKTCIDTWLERNVRCPVCRHDIRQPAASSEAQ